MMKLASASSILILAIAHVVLTSPSTVRAGAPKEPIMEAALPEFIDDSDVVAAGKVVTARESWRAGIGGCGPPGYGPFDLVDAELVVEHVFTGIVIGDTIHFSLLIVGNRAHASLAAGRDVLVWGQYQCRDAGRLWGSYASYDEASDKYLFERMYLVGPNAGRRELRSFERKVLLESAGSGRIAGKKGRLGKATMLALFVVGRAKSSARDRTGSYECSEGRVISGPHAVLPTRLEVSADPICLAVSEGDSILLALGPGDIGRDRLITADCLSSFKVKSGWVPYFGMTLERMGTIVSTDPVDGHLRFGERW